MPDICPLCGQETLYEEGDYAECANCGVIVELGN